MSLQLCAIEAETQKEENGTLSTAMPIVECPEISSINTSAGAEEDEYASFMTLDATCAISNTAEATEDLPPRSTINVQQPTENGTESASSDAAEVEAELQIDSDTRDASPVAQFPPHYPPVIYPPVFIEERQVTDYTHTNMGADQGPDSFNGNQTNVDENEDEDEDDEDEDEDEEDDEDLEDNSSEVSEGEDLREDLEDALAGDFDFKGSFYYAAVAPTAPNPCLNIEGIGTIGLPLSARDARAIIDCSARAPFGRGAETVVDTKVRDTWEIEPEKVKFDNPAWTHFIETYVIKTVWEALGVTAFPVHPKCEIYKLLLYEAGSHFLPHQDTEKADGMFATVIIVLPSAYMGGEVHVSHSSSYKVLDFSPVSLTSTSLLAWYTDVTHEVKPLKSGYRLALSYNLIHAAPGIPRPTLPDMSDAVSRLRHVLRKWRRSMYEEEENFIAYLLEHKYSEANLRSGARSLKGADAYLVTNVRTVAEDLGYMVCLANLEYHVTGTADDCGHNHRKRGRYDWDDFYGERESTPGMEEVFDTSMTLKNFVDLEGDSMLGNKLFSISEANLIPKNPFEDATPDDTDYEGYMGNYGGSVDHWYHRTVLVLVHEDDADAMLYAGGGTQYALHWLRKSTSNTPSLKDKNMAGRVLNSLNATDETTVSVMYNYALRWKDINMWKTVIKKSGSLITTFGSEQLIQAWKIFGFEDVCQTFEEMLLTTTQLGNCVDFIQALSPHAAAEEYERVQAWSEEQVRRAFSSLKSPTTADIPVLIAIGRVRGCVFLVKEILPQLVKNTSIFDFVIAFVKALHEHRESIPEQPPSPPEFNNTNPPVTNNNMTMLIDQLLNHAVTQWDSVVAQPNHTYAHDPYNCQPQVPPSQTQKIQRIITLVEICLLTKHMAPCNKLFLSVLKVQEPATQKFQTLYTPLVPRLREVMKARGVDLCSPPFSEFLQLLVGSYLRDVLGAQGRNYRIRVRKIGCGCGDCSLLDSFIVSTTRTTETFRLAQTRRLHLESCLNGAQDFLSFVTIRSGSPHSVKVTKHPEIVTAQQWETRLNQAKAFLLSIGNDDEISRLMGNRYGDVMKASTGEQPFVLTVGDAAPRYTVPSTHTSSTSPSSNSSNVAAVSSSSNRQSNPSTSITSAGMKRKKTPIRNLGVIDLTGDSP